MKMPQQCKFIQCKFIALKVFTRANLLYVYLPFATTLISQTNTTAELRDAVVSPYTEDKQTQLPIYLVVLLLDLASLIVR